MILVQGEIGLISAGATLYREEDRFYSPPRVSENRAYGTLYLTNLRITFESAWGGWIPRPVYDVPLHEVSNVYLASTKSMLTGTKEFLIVEANRTATGFEVPGAQNWCEAIVRAKFSAPAPPPPPPNEGKSRDREPGVRVPVVVNVQAPEAPKVMLHCRHCGSLFDATKGRCGSCGAPSG